MTSLPTDADNGAPLTDAPLTGVAGWHSVLPVPQHPIEAWIDLMEVVEALCPVWPERDGAGQGDYRL